MKQCGFWLVLAMFGLGVRVEASEVIVSMVRVWQVNSQSEHFDCTAVNLRLGHQNEEVQVAYLLAGLAAIEQFPVFVDLNESTSGSAFTEFVSRITDGNQGVLTFRPLMLCDSTLVPFETITEQEFDFFGGESDLAAYNIASIRVNYLEMDLDLVDGVHGSFHARLDFLGDPIPEPSVIVLFCVLVSLASLKRNRKSIWVV